MFDFEELLAEIAPDWETDGFGIDSILICPEHGERVEQDGVCPEGCVSPLRGLGLI